MPVGGYEVMLIKDGAVQFRTLGHNYTDGWVGILQSDSRRKNTPAYVPLPFEPTRHSDGVISIPEDIISLVETSWLEKFYWASYFFSRDFQLNTNVCELSLRFRQIALGSMREPAMIRISLLTDDGMVEVPILDQASNGSADVIVSSDRIKETDSRIKLLRVEDAYQWQRVKLQLKDQILRIYLNQDLVVSIPYTKALGNLTTIRAKFQGLGEIEDVVLKDEQGNRIPIGEPENL